MGAGLQQAARSGRGNHTSAMRILLRQPAQPSPARCSLTPQSCPGRAVTAALASADSSCCTTSHSSSSASSPSSSWASGHRARRAWKGGTQSVSFVVNVGQPRSGQRPRCRERVLQLPVMPSFPSHLEIGFLVRQRGPCRLGFHRSERRRRRWSSSCSSSGSHLRRRRQRQRRRHDAGRGAAVGAVDATESVEAKHAI